MALTRLIILALALTRLIILALALTRLIILALACVIRPHHARCPDGRDLRTGIQRDGHFACWSHPIGSPDDDGTFGRPDRSIQRDDVLEGRLYCGALWPIVVDWRTVGCQVDR